MNKIPKRTRLAGGAFRGNDSPVNSPRAGSKGWAIRTPLTTESRCPMPIPRLGVRPPRQHSGAALRADRARRAKDRLTHAQPRSYINKICRPSGRNWGLYPPAVPGTATGDPPASGILTTYRRPAPLRGAGVHSAPPTRMTPRGAPQLPMRFAPGLSFRSVTAPFCEFNFL